MRIGVDVGGTNTDAVLMDGRNVVSFVKTATTQDVKSGVSAAIISVLELGNVDASSVKVVMIGTTQFTNAFVERRHLLPVATVRLSLPAGAGLPPMTDWPSEIRSIVDGGCYQAHGGYEFDGRELSPFDETEIEKIAKDIADKGITTVALSSCFAPLNPDMEIRAGEIIGKIVPRVRITLSSEIGRIGLLERENAAIMNACLADLSVKVVDAFKNALTELGIKAPFYISQNDGTLMSAETVAKYPVHTFASGPTNSMRGAAFLSGVEDAIVVDIGGTTTDVGVLRSGFPRESTAQVDIGGVRTNFRMPDLHSIGLGGGSIVDQIDAEKVGPQSVGYRLEQDAMIFGGEVLTATDITVAATGIDIGDKGRLSALSPEFINQASSRIHQLADEAIDRMKTSAEKIPVILVGGGAILISRDLSSASEVIRPESGSVANAIGAAIAQVGGEVDRVFDFNVLGREKAIAIAKSEAIERAVQAGASREGIRIVDVDEIPLAYLAGSVRVHVKAVGELELSN